MSSYVKPQVLVFQEFSIVPTEITEPLRAHIAGPHAVLHRYSVSAEKDAARLGSYNRLDDTCYLWPDREPGSLVDPGYTKLYIDDALLLYYSHNVGDPANHNVTPVAGKTNWIQSNVLKFKTNGGETRSDVFNDRDVQLGDVVYLRSVTDTEDSCVETELTTTVVGFASEATNSVIEPAYTDPDNQASVAGAAATASINVVHGSNLVNCITVAEATGGSYTGYNGLASGDVVEEYLIEVVKSSVASCQAARLRVTSASGRDNVAELDPGNFGAAVSIGTRGLKLVFSNTSTAANCTANAVANGIPATSFVVGQKWRVVVGQAYDDVRAAIVATAPNTVSGGKIYGQYTGAKNDTYIVECTKGGTWATQPEISVRTAKGLDYSGPTAVTSSTYATGVSVGSSGVRIKFVGDTGGELATSVNPIVNVTAGGAGYVTAPTVTFSAAPAGGTTATGTAVLGIGANSDKVVSVTVTNRGAGYTAAPTITIAAPPAGAGNTTATATATLTGADTIIGLRKGDKWYVPVTSSQAGPVRRLILRDDLPTLMASAAELDLKLFIKDNIQVAENRVESAPEVNYEAEATQICVKEGVTAYHPEWTAAGAEQPLPVYSGTLYVQYREWLADLADEVNAINNPGDLDQIKGQLDPDNPLKWGVYKALSNSNGTAVKYTAVRDPENLDSWVEVLERLKGRDDLYNLVPLTFNTSVHNLWAAQTVSESNEFANNWKAAVVALKARPTVLVVGEGAAIAGVSGNVIADPVLAVLEDDPNATNTQYTQLRVPTGSGYFITNNVRPGDVVRYLFTVDGFFEEQYEEFVVDEVLSENTLRLYSGADAAVNAPQRVEIYHNNNRNEIADDIAQQAGALSSRRVVAVWPDQVGEAGVLQPGYYLAAAIAGLASGVVPQQGLTNVEVAGFDDFTRSYKYFNETQLNKLAEAGVWIVTEDRDGTPHSRHALTTDNLDLNRREEMIRRNVDSMSYLFLRRLRPYIGRTNATPSMVTLLRNQLTETISALATNGTTAEIGSQLIDGSIRVLRIHPLLKDRIEVILDLTVPAPLNNIELHLVV
jgi:hypothetical protein